MTPRQIFHWKTWFYDVLLPILRRLGPKPCDFVLATLGRIASTWPARHRLQSENLARARRSLNADWDVSTARRDLARNTARFVARDYPLDQLAQAEALARFDVRGFEHLESCLQRGRGVIVLGCHLGAYLAGLHWLFRREVPIRLLVQRPGHLSRFLSNEFDRDDVPHPQSGFFLRRRMAPGEGAERLLPARSALRDGLAVYLSGDIPWPACHPRPGRLLGRTQPFQSAWSELAALTKTPVVPVFCLHGPGGRYRLSFDPPSHPDPASAVPLYLKRLEREIAANPGEAVAHLTWPCYTEEAAATTLPGVARPVTIGARG